jgi:hypothetical protein
MRWPSDLVPAQSTLAGGLLRAVEGRGRNIELRLMTNDPGTFTATGVQMAPSMVGSWAHKEYHA